MHDGQYLWLISNVPANPTITSLLAAQPNLPAAAAQLIAVDIGQALSALHAADLAHGDVNGGTVILSPEGRALLVECGYAHALAGTTPGPGHDVTGWTTLVRSLAAASGNDALLSKAADDAERIGGSAGLNTALEKLTASATQVPGYGERSALALLASLAPVHTTPVAAPVAPSTPESVTVKLPSPDGAPSLSSAATAPLGDAPTISPEELATRLGKRNEEVLRLGRGVAQAPPPQQVPAAPTWQTPTATYQETRRPAKPWRRRIISILSGATTVVILAVVGWFVVQRLTPLEVTGVAVGIAQPLPANACDTQVDVVGTITSNGGGGAFTYRWVRSDGATTSIFTESVSFGRDVTQVHLLWKFSGKGTIKAKATLQILTPRALESSTDFTYTCK
ncbi:MAG TPA: hypothetical protein DGT23_22330 [Micromonosporaceae bacterium]|nr:hypothetical protein [Micromonosporaceae bacterium]